MSAALECRDVTVRFGAFTAIDGVSLSFAPGRLYGVIGPNGAGKTTLLNVLSGRLYADAGRVMLEARDVTDEPAHARARSGLGRSFQITKLFAGLTVFESLRLAGLSRFFRFQPFWRPIGSYRRVAEAADAMLETLGLAHRRDTIAEQLSHGEQRALEMGLSLMGEPRVLLLDEPLAGVGQHEIEHAVALIERVRVGRTVVLIEHNMQAVMRLSDEIVVMVRGRVLAAGAPEAIQRDPAVRAAYLGDAGPDARP
jgi:branched-chain amino acid transport system ATP-binding protein